MWQRPHERKKPRRCIAIYRMWNKINPPSYTVSVKGDLYMEERNPSGRVHKVSMTGRRELLLTGVEDVMSFDEQEILLETSDGMLAIEGEDLHVKRLSLERGELDVEGRVVSLVYSEKNGFRQKGESLFARLFR